MRSINHRCVVTIALGLLFAGCSGGDDSAKNSTGGTGGTATGGTGGTAAGGTGATGGTAAGGTGGTAAGGTSGSGGTAGSGGTTTTTSCTGADAAEISRVHAWLTDSNSGLPDYAYTNVQKFFDSADKLDGLACAIAASCTAFAPAESGWLEYCEAVITSAVVAESSYDPTEVVLDSYGQRTVNGTTANDPTVGLLQIRFSSTVDDFNYYGPLAKMPAIGCDWPSELPAHDANDDVFWATAGGTTYTSWMQTPGCNIALATWYYFENATGNGGQTPIYAYQYCAGQGIAGDMVIGLLSHLEGPGFPRPPDASNPYVTGIKSRFVSLLGGTLPSPDPFTQTLSPETAKYCK